MTRAAQTLSLVLLASSVGPPFAILLPECRSFPQDSPTLTSQEIFLHSNSSLPPASPGLPSSHPTTTVSLFTGPVDSSPEDSGGNYSRVAFLGTRHARSVSVGQTRLGGTEIQ